MGAQWKHKGKTAAADAKGRLFTKLAKEIAVAAKAGGPDPEKNSRLRMAMEQGRKASMPRETLERSVKKGAGLTDEQVSYETVTYEGFAPHKVPVIVECLTENKNRTATNIRMLFRKGQLAASGAVSWDFKRVGLVEAMPGSPGVDAEGVAIEAGAQEVEPADEGAFHFVTEPADLDTVAKSLTGQGWKVHSASLAWTPKNPVQPDAAARTEVEAFLEALDEDEDVQAIFVAMKA
jgi:YebC/PmpR family DNA-binding regulatory protein